MSATVPVEVLLRVIGWRGIFAVLAALTVAVAALIFVVVPDRGADAGPWRKICALPAFWTGLFYDQGALDAAWDLVKDWTEEDHAYLRDEASRRALGTPFKGTTLVLWLGPAVIAGLGLWVMVVFLRRHRGQGGGIQAATAKAASRPRPPPLTDDEKKRLEKLLKEDGP